MAHFYCGRIPLECPETRVERRRRRWRELRARLIVCGIAIACAATFVGVLASLILERR